MMVRPGILQALRRAGICRALWRARDIWQNLLFRAASCWAKSPAAPGITVQRRMRADMILFY
jgi:hypothetical protein